MIIRSGVSTRNRTDRGGPGPKPGNRNRTEPNRPVISTDFGGITGYFPVIPEYRPIRIYTDPGTGRKSGIWVEDSTDRTRINRNPGN